MIKAGSLLYAIYVCLIIAILSGGLIYIFTINKTLATRYDIKEQLVDRCQSCFDYYLKTSRQNNEAVNKLDLFNDGLICELTEERWGMFSKLSGKAFFKTDTVNSQFIIGEKKAKNSLALYLCDFGEELKISGSTKIHGNVKLPKKRYKTVNILGNQQINNPKLDGSIGVSSQNLPKIIPPELIYPENTWETSLEQLRNKSIVYRGFDQSTAIVFLDKGTDLDRIQLKGNFIIKSLDTIRISNTAKLEDVIIQSPKVIVEEGFDGSIQLYADKEVVVESNVRLRYPSCIVIDDSARDYEKKITIDEDVEIYGGLVIDGNSFRERQNNFIDIEENTMVVGDIYCNGILQLKGSVIGTVYTHKLQLETKSSKYADVILNGVIDTENIPEGYVGLPLFSNSNEKALERIKKI